MMSRRREWLLNLAVVIATVSAVIMTGLRLRDSRQAAKRAETTAARKAPRQVSGWKEVGSVGNRLGPPSSKVTIVEFSDFRCPFCRLQAVDLREIRRRFPGEVAVVYRHLPTHGPSREAAVASECAGRAGVFEAYHDLLFAKADSIGKKPWTAFALEAGIADTMSFGACLFDIAVARLVESDMAAAAELKVSVTPTLLINDIVVPGHTKADSLERLVLSALEKGGSKSP